MIGFRTLESKSKRGLCLSLILVVHSAMLSFSAYVHSPMTDEIAHFAAGLGHWLYGDFELYNVNPPLARTVGTLPVYFAMARDEGEFNKLYSHVGSSLDENGLIISHRKEFSIGDRLMSHLGPDYFFWMTIARWSCILFSCLGAWVCYAWASDLYGRNAGFVALMLWCTSPLVLAFGGALTPDVPSGAMGTLALYRYWKWTKESSFGNAYVAGLSVGLAELTKSTWILLHPSLLALTACLCISRSSRFSLAIQGVFQLALAWIVLLAGYGFSDQFKLLGDFEFASPQLQIREYSQTGELLSAVGNRFRNTGLGSIPIPLPTELVRGIDTQESAMAAHNIVGFLFGELRLGGWWYYYLAVLMLKCTVGELGLFAIATLGNIAILLSAIRSKSTDSSTRGVWKFLPRIQIETILLLGPVVLYLFLLSYHTGLNRHARYMLQFLPLCFVWASQTITFFTNRPLLRVGTILIVTWGGASSLYHFPHSLSYFNEFFGGPSQGYKYLSGTNVDWGHNIFYLRDELEQRGWDSVGASLWTRYDLAITGISAEITKIPKRRRTSSHLPTRNDLEENVLLPGRYVVSVCIVQGAMGVPTDIKYGDPIDNGYTYFQEFTPIGHIGYSIWLYDLSENDILASEAWGDVYRKHIAEQQE